MIVPIDPILARRYSSMFEDYSISSQKGFQKVKKHIASMQKKLRSDASYFLLVNIDQMIIQPYQQPDPSIRRIFDGNRLAKYYNSAELITAAISVIDIVVANAERDAGGLISANSIVRSIAQNSEQISSAVLWWTED